MKENDGVYSRDSARDGTLYCEVKGGAVLCNVKADSLLHRVTKRSGHITQYPLDRLVLPMEFFE